jgi:hypothetical protein
MPHPSLLLLAQFGGSGVKGPPAPPFRLLVFIAVLAVLFVAAIVYRLIRYPPRYRLRELLITTSVVAIVLGLVGYFIRNEPRWMEQDRAARARANAEQDRLAKINLDASKELMDDLESIHTKIGRYPDDQEELVRLRGKPMPLLHGKQGDTEPIQYERSSPKYKLIYRFSN